MMNVSFFDDVDDALRAQEEYAESLGFDLNARRSRCYARDKFDGDEHNFDYG